MIHLIGNYYADPNNMGFTLLEQKSGKDKDGNATYNTIGYCGSFEETIFLLKRKVVDQRLKSQPMELSEALAIIRETTEEIKNAVNGVLEGNSSQIEIIGEIGRPATEEEIQEYLNREDKTDE